MQSISVRYVGQPEAGPCPSCGGAHAAHPGPRLFQPDEPIPLCPACCKKHAPRLVALLELAHTAEKVGRKSRHLLTPPMEGLLDLARAAENYSLAPKATG
jgi:hypothetical protein